jgi:hypothetical protein
LEVKTCTYCPAANPLFDGQKCVACPPNQYYNQNSNTCIPCQSNKVYDQPTNTCVCADPAPFWNGNKCIPCFLPNYFDLDSRQCLSCPSGQHFDLTLKHCTPNWSSHLFYLYYYYRTSKKTEVDILWYGQCYNLKLGW